MKFFLVAMQCHLWRISRQQRRNSNQDDNDSLQDTLHDEDGLWRDVVGPGVVNHRGRKRRLAQAIVDTLPTRIYGEEKQVHDGCQELSSEEKKEEEEEDQIENKTVKDEEAILSYHQHHEEKQPMQNSEEGGEKEESNGSSCITNKSTSFSILSTVVTLNHNNDNEQQEYHQQLQEQASCVICLESFIHGDVLRILPCHHEYHRDCIGKY